MIGGGHRGVHAGKAHAQHDDVVLRVPLDGIGIGLGFTLSLTVIGAVREMLGAGAIFGYTFADGVMPLLFILAPGGFLVLGYLMVLFNKVAKR